MGLGAKRGQAKCWSLEGSSHVVLLQLNNSPRRDKVQQAKQMPGGSTSEARAQFLKIMCWLVL